MLHLDNIGVCLCPFQFTVHDYSAVSFEAASAIDVKSLNNPRADYPTYISPPPAHHLHSYNGSDMLLRVCMYTRVYIYIYMLFYLYIKIVLLLTETGSV